MSGLLGGLLSRAFGTSAGKASAPKKIDWSGKNTPLIAAGGAGDDTFIGGNVSDALYGANGADSLNGGPGSDLLLGGDGNDTLTGGTGNDLLYGEKGDDILAGGSGQNLLAGGAGKDTFVADSAGGSIVADFNSAQDKLDLSSTNIRNITDLVAATKTVLGGIRIGFEGGGYLTLLGTKVSSLTSANVTFAASKNAPPAEGDIIEEASSGELNLSGGSSRFFSQTAPLVIDLTGSVSFSATSPVVVLLNGIPIAASSISIGSNGKQMTLNAPLTEGRNDVRVFATDTEGKLLGLDTTLWAGLHTLTVRVVDKSGAPLVGASVTAKLQEDQSILSLATTGADGTALFANLPNRNILLESNGAGGLFGSLGVLGGQGASILTLGGFNEPSPIANNDFSQGLAGWDVGTAPVSLVEHQETGSAPAIAPAASLAATNSTSARGLGVPDLKTMGTASAAPSLLAADTDLVLLTAGQGEQSISRTFVIDSGTANVKVRFQFITTEVPGGYFGTQYNDYYRVAIRSQNGGATVSESNSMNGLGLGAFDANGATAFREVSLATDKQGDTIQVDVAVANVADGLLGSSVVVDLVKESQLDIRSLKLNDIDNKGLSYLSADSDNPYFGGNTRVNGTITIHGSKDDSLQDVVLEVVSGGKVVATANLAAAAKTTLIGPTFGDDNQIALTASNLLFELPNAQAAGVPTDKNQTVSLRVKATSTSGEEATKDFGAVPVLTHFEGGSRYGGRDLNQGGDDWVLPSTKTVLDHFASQVTYGDMSNMNGGPFPIHAGHKAGNEADGWYDGYNARNAATAQTMINLLNDATYGSKITTALVTYDAKAGNAFFDAISGVTLKDGRSATDVIRPFSDHDTHFHWVISA